MHKKYEEDENKIYIAGTIGTDSSFRIDVAKKMSVWLCDFFEEFPGAEVEVVIRKKKEQAEINFEEPECDNDDCDDDDCDHEYSGADSVTGSMGCLP